MITIQTKSMYNSNVSHTKVVSANAAASSAGCVGISVVYCASPDAYQYTVYQYVTDQY